MWGSPSLHPTSDTGMYHRNACVGHAPAKGPRAFAVGWMQFSPTRDMTAHALSLTLADRCGHERLRRRHFERERRQPRGSASLPVGSIRAADGSGPVRRVRVGAGAGRSCSSAHRSPTGNAMPCWRRSSAAARGCACTTCGDRTCPMRPTIIWSNWRSPGTRRPSSPTTREISNEPTCASRRCAS